MALPHRRQWFRGVFGAIAGLFVAAKSSALSSQPAPRRSPTFPGLGSRITTSYDLATGLATTYDDQGRVLSVQNWKSIGSRTTTTYDIYGRVVK